MPKKHEMTAEEARELFSELDESGVLDPSRKQKKSVGRHRVEVDPLSDDDPSGSQVSKTISRTAILVIVAVFVIVFGMQIWYGVNRRLSTANLSENVDRTTVENALESGVEWGNGFTQFPQSFTVDEADETTGVIEVSVLDTDSANELELLSNSQIQAAALATNALLNEHIDRVTYNVSTLVGSDGSFQRDRFFGFLPAQGTRRAMLTFIWTKNKSSYSNYIDWELKIVGMDDVTAARIQEQVNSVSSLVDKPAVTQGQIEEERREMQREHLLHGAEIFRGGKSEKPIE